MWQHIRFVAPAFGMVVGFPLAHWAGRRWPGPTIPPAEQRLLADAEAIAFRRRVRRSARWYGLRRVVGWLFLGLLPLLALNGCEGERADQRLIDTQPHRNAEIVRVYKSPLARGSESPDITVLLDGERRALSSEFPGDHNAKVDDVLEVVQDPRDLSYVIAVTSQDSFWYTPLGEAVLFVGLGALVGFLCFAGVPPLRVIRSVARAHGPERTLVEQVSDRELVLIGGDGAHLAWPVPKRWEGVRSGPVLVLGDLRPGGWVVIAAAAQIFWWPKAPLSEAHAPARSADSD